MAVATKSFNRFLKEGTPIDFDYKLNALRVTYDIESTHELFTLAMIHEHALSFMMFGDSQFDDLTNDDIRAQMHDFLYRKTTLKYMNLNEETAKDIDLNVYRYHTGDVESMSNFADDLQSMIVCEPLRFDKKYATKNKDFVEYCGWNSFRYDLSMICAIKSLIDVKREKLQPEDIKRISDSIVGNTEPEWKLPYYLESRFMGNIKAQSYKLYRNLAIYSDGHIDWAKMMKAEDSDKLTPPSLKKEMARFGLDIVIDEVVHQNGKRQWSENDKTNLIAYNFNDVLGTRVISENNIVENYLLARDIVRGMYPFTSSRATSINDLHKWTPLERDITAANLAGAVLCGPNHRRPADWSTIQYTFPLPSKDDKSKIVNQDLYDYILEKEPHVDPLFKQFFEHFRDKNTRDRAEDWKIKHSQPVTHSPQMSLPYYRNGKPVDSFIRLSTGGAHGSVYAGLHNMTPKEITMWIKTDAGVPKELKFTVDQNGVIHIDFSSFYPIIASKMKLYLTSEGIDRYTNIIKFRFEQKDLATKLWEQGLRGTDPEFTETQDLQMGLKFILNNATGAANQHKHGKNVYLDLDNKTLSMRLVGNMLIWVMAQRLTDAGAFVISTNTDGLYVGNFTVEKAKEVIKKYVEDYDMSVGPEELVRFINRDTSNRIEFDNTVDKFDKVNGILRHGASLDFTRQSIGRNVPYPLISGSAVLNYMSSNPNWLQEPYNKNKIVDYIKNVRDNKKDRTINSWFVVYAGTSSRRLTVNGARQQAISRVIFTKNGDHISNEKRGAINSEEVKQMWNQLVSNSAEKVGDLKFTQRQRVSRGVYEDVEDKFIFADDLIADNFISNYDFALGYKFTDPNTHTSSYVPALRVDEASSKSVFEDSAEFMKFKRSLQSSSSDRIVLIYKPHEEFSEDDNEDEWSTVKAWKDGVITGFTSDTADMVNTEESLSAFDFNKIDIEPYVSWAETLLSNWKVSADVPELGMRKIDDTVNEEITPKRKTKSTIAIEVIHNMYDEALAGIK